MAICFLAEQIAIDDRRKNRLCEFFFASSQQGCSEMEIKMDNKYTVGIITASDKGSKGEREDISGRRIKELLPAEKYEVVSYKVLPDEQTELEQAKRDEQQQYADMCTRIQFLYENSGVSYADVLMSSESMSDMLNQPEYVSAMADYDYSMLEQLVATRQKIADDEQQLQINLSAVEQLTAEVEDEQATVNQLIETKSQEVAQYDDQIARQQKVIEECDAEVQAAAARIAELEEAARKAQSRGEFVPYSGGAFVWPCPSSTRITSYFGYRTPDGGYVNANHKGIDIGAPTGTPGVAAASGVVVIARYSASAGNWVVISHGNGLYTMYMHASQLLVSEGQYVNAGDTILLVGSTGWSTGPHLHFGVGVGGYTSAYAVDPLSYFQ